MYYWISELVTLSGIIAALIIGKSVWITPKGAWFPKFVAAGLGCMALGCLHDAVYLFITGHYADDICIGHLGVIGCFLFLISASYGQLDGIFDDRSKQTRKYRLLALLAPLVMTLIFIPALRADHLSPVTKAVNFIGWIPMIIASYFNFKHAILPDGGFAFVKAARPYNITATLFGFVEVVELTMYLLEKPQMVVISAVLLAATACGMMFFAKRGAEQWTI
ncbi:MAG: hypothetical protein IIV61_05945 [Oscillospiraceae bacterium]|jgi:hypothetical protein|nr:hypothetical protein [Oscillospiraceae bacterium]